MQERSKHQEKIIRNYYKNRDAIALQRVQELASDLFLTEGKKREKVWEHLVTHLEKLEVPKSRIEHLRQRDDPQLVGELVRQLVQKG